MAFSVPVTLMVSNRISAPLRPFSALALIFLPRLTIPLVIAYVFYLVMRPVMPWLMKRGLSREFSIGVVFLGMIFLTTYPVYKFVPTITEETKNFQFFLPKIEKYIKNNLKNVLGLNKRTSRYEFTWQSRIILNFFDLKIFTKAQVKTGIKLPSYSKMSCPLLFS